MLEGTLGCLYEHWGAGMNIGVLVYFRLWLSLDICYHFISAPGELGLKSGPLSREMIAVPITWLLTSH